MICNSCGMKIDSNSKECPLCKNPIIWNSRPQKDSTIEQKFRAVIAKPKTETESAMDTPPTIPNAPMPVSVPMEEPIRQPIPIPSESVEESIYREPAYQPTLEEEIPIESVLPPPNSMPPVQEQMENPIPFSENSQSEEHPPISNKKKSNLDVRVIIVITGAIVVLALIVIVLMIMLFAGGKDDSEKNTPTEPSTSYPEDFTTSVETTAETEATEVEATEAEPTTTGPNEHDGHLKDSHSGNLDYFCENRFMALEEIYNTISTEDTEDLEKDKEPHRDSVSLPEGWNDEYPIDIVEHLGETQYDIELITLEKTSSNCKNGFAKKSDSDKYDTLFYYNIDDNYKYLILYPMDETEDDIEVYSHTYDPNEDDSSEDSLDWDLYTIDKDEFPEWKKIIQEPLSYKLSKQFEKKNNDEVSATSTQIESTY